MLAQVNVIQRAKCWEQCNLDKFCSFTQGRFTLVDFSNQAASVHHASLHTYPSSPPPPSVGQKIYPRLLRFGVFTYNV